VGIREIFSDFFNEGRYALREKKAVASKRSRWSTRSVEKSRNESNVTEVLSVRFSCVKHGRVCP
jgi:hypothetical protein